MNVIYIQDQEIYSYNNRYYHPKSEHYFTRYLEGLNDHDNLIVCSGVIDIEEDRKELILKYKEVSHPRIRFKRIPEFRVLKNQFLIYKFIRKIVKNADFCYLRCGIASSIAGYYCRMNKIPYMAILNEDVFRNNIHHPRLLVKLSAFPLYYFSRKLVENADYACYVTQQFLQERYPCNGKTLGCSDIEFLEYNNLIVDKRIEKIDNGINRVVLGSVGNVNVKLKGYDTAIKALALIKKEGRKKLKYQLVGGGNQEPLKKLAKTLGVSDWIEFMGEYSHDNVLKWLETIDIYLHPSRSEGLPRAILEAMTKATPCVCSTVGGIPELIKDEYLFSYDGNEVEQLKEIICSMTDDKMKVEVRRNYEKSKEYSPIELEKKRKIFFAKAIQSIK